MNFLQNSAVFESFEGLNLATFRRLSCGSESAVRMLYFEIATDDIGTVPNWTGITGMGIGIRRTPEILTARLFVQGDARVGSQITNSENEERPWKTIHSIS